MEEFESGLGLRDRKPVWGLYSRGNPLVEVEIGFVAWGQGHLSLLRTGIAVTTEISLPKFY